MRGNEKVEKLSCTRGIRGFYKSPKGKIRMNRNYWERNRVREEDSVYMHHSESKEI